MGGSLTPNRVKIADIAATGTPDGATFLRGDGSWATPSGGGVGGAVDSVNGQTGVVSLDAADVGAVPTTRTVAGKALSADVSLVKADVGLSNVDNTADAAKPVSTAQQAALDAKAPTASPTFTGTVSGVTKAMVGLGSVDNTSDAAKPVSTATQAALDGKVPTTRTVAGKPLSADVALVKGDVGLGNVDNTSDAAKPVSTAQQTALDGKVPTTRTVNGLALSGNITLNAGDVGATKKFVAAIGDGTATSIVVTHNLNTRDFSVGARKTASPYTNVYLEIEATTLNTATVKLENALATNEVTLTLIG